MLVKQKGLPKMSPSIRQVWASYELSKSSKIHVIISTLLILAGMAAIGARAHSARVVTFVTENRVSAHVER